MAWYKNFKVRTKMLLAFIVVIALVACAGVYLITSLKTIDDNYSAAMSLTEERIDHIFTSKDRFSRARMIMREAFYPDVTKDDLVRLQTELDAELNELTKELKALYEVAAPAVQ